MNLALQIVLKMNLIDTHSHIYVPAFDVDREEMLKRSFAGSINTILMPAIDSGTHESMLALEKKFPENCLAMMGLHPCSVNEGYENELAIVESYFAERAFRAVGEIGLDFYWDKTFTTQQYEAFHRQIKLALQYEVPIVIHSRESTDECIDVVRQYKDKNLKGVFHCFSGNEVQARSIIELGFYLGIGGVVTFKNGGLDKVMQDISLDHVVLETDAPYLAPVPFRGKRNEPSYLAYIVDKLSGITGKPRDEVADKTTRNARILFNLP